MAQSLMQSAQTQTNAAKTGEDFTPKDPREFVPEESRDAVDRVVAAGMKLLYSAEMEDERQEAIQSPQPVAKKLADNITGLMLTLDQQSKGGIPQAALFPAAVMLLNEAGQMLIQAGQKVTQDDYNESMQILYVQIGKKLGATDDQLMTAAQEALAKKGGGEAPVDPAGAPAVPPAVPPAGAMPPQQGV